MGFVIGMLLGAVIGILIMCCLFVDDEEEIAMMGIIEKLDKEVNRQYKEIQELKEEKDYYQAIVEHWE